MRPAASEALPIGGGSGGPAGFSASGSPHRAAARTALVCGGGDGGAASAVRLGTGLAVGIAFVLAFGLTGVDRAVLLLLSVGPVALVSVTFALLENLDVKLATSALSLSLVASLVLSTLVTLLTA